MIQGYVSLLVDDLREQARTKTPIDIVQRLNWVTFDIIGDLAFGESFGALQKKQTHPWIKSFFKMLYLGCYIFEFLDLPGGQWFKRHFIIPSLSAPSAMQDFATQKISERLERGSTSRPDLMHFVLKNNEKGKGMSKREIISTFNVFVLAGSETTATVVSSAIFLLCHNPRVMQKLKEEVYDAFKHDKDINLTKVNQRNAFEHPSSATSALLTLCSPRLMHYHTSMPFSKSPCG